MKQHPPVSPLARGPADHVVRDQIVEAANQCFALYGYKKTTVADLARSIGFSKAYIYRFFDSKQAVGEAICQARLDQLIAEACKAMNEGGSAADRLRRMFRSVVALSVTLFFEDRKIFEIAALAALEQWEPATRYTDRIMAVIEQLVKDGRDNGEFERKTPLDETCRSIFYAMTPFFDPLHLQRNLDTVPEAQNEVMNLILRSLSP